jgi:hypothetical protein
MSLSIGRAMSNLQSYLIGPVLLLWPLIYKMGPGGDLGYKSHDLGYFIYI